MFQTTQENNGREFVIWLLKLLKKRIVTVSILSSFSVFCQCYLRGLSPIFGAMLPVAFPSWKASYIVYAQSLKYCASIIHFLSVYYFVMIDEITGSIG